MSGLSGKSEADESGYWLGGHSISSGPQSVEWFWTDGSAWDYASLNEGGVDKNLKTEGCLHAGVVEKNLRAPHIMKGDEKCFSWGNMEKCSKEMNFVCKKDVNKNYIPLVSGVVPELSS